MAIKEQNKKYYGKEWKELSKKLIEEVRKCEVCGKTLEELRDEGKWLTVHHKNRKPWDNRRENLLVCCPRCHFRQEFLINKGELNPNQLSLAF